MPQSCTFSSQSPKRPLPMLSGIQLMVLLLRIRSSLHGGHLDEPGIARVVDERRVAAPAVRIAVLEVRARQRAARGSSRSLSTSLIRVLAEHARPTGSLRSFRPWRPPAGQTGRSYLLADLGVVLTEGGRDVNDAGTVGQRDIGVADDIVCLFALRGDDVARKVEERLVLLALEVGAADMSPALRNRPAPSTVSAEGLRPG